MVALGGGRVVAYPRPSTAAASAVMRGNRKRDTTQELAVRRLLYARGLRYRVNPLLRLAGGTRVRPDVVFPGRRIAVFIDGCFWHGCTEHGTNPRINRDYWGPKLARNQARDKRNTAALEADGWVVIRVWEHQPTDAIVRVIGRALRRAGARSSTE